MCSNNPAQDSVSCTKTLNSNNSHVAERHFCHHKDTPGPSICHSMTDVFTLKLGLSNNVKRVEDT